MLGADVGDVVALDPERHLLHPERLGELRERRRALGPAPLLAQPVLGQRQLRVALGELAQPALVAALGRPHLDLGAAPLAERLGQHLGPARRARGRRRRAAAPTAPPRSTGRGTARRPPRSRARPRCRGRSPGARRGRRRGPGTAARWRRCPRPRRRSGRRCRPTRRRPAGAPSASAPRRAGRGTAPRARTPDRSEAASIFSSRSRSTSR